jgi:hypothetical protein
MEDGVLGYGGGDTDSASNGNANFAGGFFNGLSFCCTPIELLSNDGTDQVTGTATGFFWLRHGKPYLVTNWHVITGRNSFTGALNPKGYIPKKIRFYGLSVLVNSGTINFSRNQWTLEWGDDAAKSLAIQPKANGQNIDIWGMPIPPDSVFGRDPHRTGFKGSTEASCFLNDHDSSRIVTNVGDDCFILGYPLQNYEGLMLPIWKRGSIASETPLGVGGRPIFLVDATTTSGMSGSPIIRKATTLTADNRDIDALQEFSSYEFIGIYAGRLEGSPLASVNIGYGWYRTMIDQALDHYNWSAPKKDDS